MHVIVTGGLGFIGSNLVDYLVNNGDNVTIIDNLSTGTYQNWNPEWAGKVTWQNNIDVTDNLLKLSFEKAEVIYHLAALARIQPSFNRPYETIRVNCDGTLRILELAREMNARVVYAGSSSFYADPHKNPYAYSKWVGEQNCIMYNKVYGVSTVIARFFNCFDDKTEILTKNGFKFFKDLKDDDEYATLNPVNKNIEYHKAIARQIYNYNGYLINFSSKSYDLNVTPEHNLYLNVNHQRKNEIYKFVTANEVFKSSKSWSYRLLSSGVQWIGEEKKYHVISAHIDSIGRTWGESKIIKMEDWCEFLGWFISEGSAFICGKNKEHRISISQYKNINPKSYERIVNLIKKMGFNPYLTKNQQEINITSVSLFKELKRLFPISGSKNKLIPDEIKCLSLSCLKILYESMMLGDGNKDGSRYTTNSFKLMNDFTELCLKLNKCTNVKYETKSRVYRIGISDNRRPYLGCHYSHKIYAKKNKYKGKVYDVTVPNHIIYVRRNGKSCWSGNCYGNRHVREGDNACVLGIFERQKMNNEPLTITGTGNKMRDFTHIDDICDGLYAMSKNIWNGEIFNLGRGHNYSINEVASMFKPVGVKYLPERNGEAENTLADITKTTEKLGWVPKRNLPDYINAFLESLNGKIE